MEKARWEDERINKHLSDSSKNYPLGDAGYYKLFSSKLQQVVDKCTKLQDAKEELWQQQQWQRYQDPLPAV